MNLSFKEAVPKPVVEEFIVFNGQKLGRVSVSPNMPPQFLYHAAFDVPNSGKLDFIQGHGSSQEIAILNAINEARRDASRLLAALDEFEAALAAE